MLIVVAKMEATMTTAMVKDGRDAENTDGGTDDGSGQWHSGKHSWNTYSFLHHCELHKKCTMGQEAEPQKRPNIPRILPVPMHPFGNNVMYPAKVFNSEELPQNTFTKEAGKQLEESKLRVVYIARNDQDKVDDNVKQTSDPSSNPAVQTAKAARDSAVKEVTQLQQEVDSLKRKGQKKGPGFSIRLAIAAGVIGIMVGLIVKLVLSSPSGPPPTLAPPPTAAGPVV